MKFYKRDPDRALAGMAELTFEQRGAYNSLLDLLYSRDGNLPDDDERVARMLSCNKREWVRLKKALVDLGKVWVKDGKIGAKRVQETINEATEFSNKQRSNVSRRWEKAEKPQENNERDIPDGNSKPLRSGNTSTPTATPKGREEERRPAAAWAWEKDLFAVEGVKGSGLELSPYGAMVQLHHDGYDLNSEVLPLVRRDIAKAIEQGRSNRLSWTTIANRVREARQDAHAARTKVNGHQTLAPPIDWERRLNVARRTNQWDTKWGPYPNQPGCLVPAALLLPEDGKGWTDYDPRKGLG